jgi:hypothetical protein
MDKRGVTDKGVGITGSVVLLFLHFSEKGAVYEWVNLIP